MVNCYDPQEHRRRSIRLQGYDYAQAGAYFVTLCTHNRECLLGQIEGGLMVLNPVGEIARNEWLRSAEIRAEIELHEFVLMPNHFHAIVVITKHDDHRGGDRCRGDRPVAPTGPKPKSLGALIAGFKSSATKRINEIRGTPGVPVWQRNYYEHIIRDENDYTRIAEYVADNPRRWAEDSLNPDAAVGAAGGVGIPGGVRATGRSPLRGTRGGRDE